MNGSENMIHAGDKTVDDSRHERVFPSHPIRQCESYDWIEATMNQQISLYYYPILSKSIWVDILDSLDRFEFPVSKTM